MARPQVGSRWTGGATWVASAPALTALLALLAVPDPVTAHPSSVSVLAPPGADLSEMLLVTVGPAIAAAIQHAWLGLLLLTTLVVIRRWPRRSALVLALLLAWFTVQTAAHAAGHPGDPGEAARCPVLSASQHVSGLAAGGDLPDQPARVSSGIETPASTPVSIVPVVLDGRGPRAPPA